MPNWEVISAELSERRVGSISPEAAFDAVELGKAVLIDVRPAADHAKAHPKNALSVPAFIVIDSPSGGDFAKWLVCKANGVVPTKPNPALADAVAAAAAAGKSAILACEAGGTLEVRKVGLGGGCWCVQRPASSRARLLPLQTCAVLRQFPSGQGVALAQGRLEGALRAREGRL